MEKENYINTMNTYQLISTPENTECMRQKKKKKEMAQNINLDRKRLEVNVVMKIIISCSNQEDDGGGRTILVLGHRG